MNLPPPLPTPAAFPPDGWLPHPHAAGQFYRGQEVVFEDELRRRVAAEATPVETTPADGIEGDTPLARMIRESTGVAPEFPQSGTFEVPPEFGEVAAQEAPDEKIDIPIPPQWQGEVADAAEREKMRWFVESEMGDIHVTELEQRLFIKQAAHNTEVEFIIHLGDETDPFNVRVRSISNKHLTALFRAMGEDRKDGLFGHGDAFDDGFFATRLQVMSMMLQVMAVNESAAESWKPAQEIDAMSQDAVIVALRSDAAAFGQTLSAPRHAAFVTAVRIFEKKFQLCKKFMVQGFSNPPG